MNAATIIAAAIDERQRLSFFYDGHTRIVEPHTFGVDKHNREMLCGYQTAGTSASGKPVGWKFFLIAKISRLQPAERARGFDEQSKSGRCRHEDHTEGG